jgi:hypothetical protein
MQQLVQALTNIKHPKQPLLPQIRKRRETKTTQKELEKHFSLKNKPKIKQYYG